ncbi:MAG: hypothetical protein IJT70_01815 [Clostridia bacterium]|nr:hypothetical protein [Clostridia bacterium]
MKKLSSIILALLLALSVALFAGCGDKEKGDPQGTENASTGSVQTSTDPGSAETPDKESANALQSEALEGLESVEEDLSGDDVISGKYDSSAYNFLKRSRFSSGDKEYSWFEFYNACLTGEIDLTDPEAVIFAKRCLEFFTENELEEETAQANSIIEAAKELGAQ